jgi:hypothetical protein
MCYIYPNFSYNGHKTSMLQGSNSRTNAIGIPFFFTIFRIRREPKPPNNVLTNCSADNQDVSFRLSGNLNEWLTARHFFFLISQIIRSLRQNRPIRRRVNSCSFNRHQKFVPSSCKSSSETLPETINVQLEQFPVGTIRSTAHA